jgi:hypothetical protein
MRLLRDVSVQDDARDGITVISLAPGVLGETMTLDLAGNGLVVTLTVRVSESRPVLLEGAVRHMVKLHVLDATRRSDTA